MTNKVLVLLDCNKEAEAALAVASQVCTPGDSLTLLSVSKPALPLRTGSKPSPQAVGAVVASSGSWVVPFAPDYSVFAETVDQSIQGRLDEAHDFLELHSAALRQQGFDVETRVEIADRAEDAIIDFARALKPTFIIMTRHSQPRLGERLFGSVAASVVASEVAPVLLVPVAS